MRSLLLLLMLAGSAGAQTPTANQPLTFYQSCFGGIDNFHDSARIDNCDFQEGRNVLTYKGYLEKRSGSFRVSDGLKPGYAISYQNEFVNTSNTDLLIVQASTQIFASDFGSAFTEIATVNVNGVTSSLSAFGKHFFVNGYDTPWYTTGSDAVLVPEIPAGCRYLTFAQERIWCANAAGAESTLYASAFGDYTDWTIPINFTADAPNSWSMDAQDGKALTCVYSSPYGVLAWKRSKTFVVKGFDNADFYKFRLSENIGCVDQRSIQLVEGKVTWLGEDGVYQWAGGNTAPELISKDIDSTIKQIRQNSANSNKRSITTPEEFEAGLRTDNGPTKGWSTTIAPGSIVASSITLMDTTSIDFGQGALNNISISTTSGSFGIASTNFSTPLDLFTDDNYSANPTWTVVGTCANLRVVGGILRTWNGNGQTCYLYTSTTTYATGEWKINFGDVGIAKGNEFWYYFVSDNSNPVSMNGYALKHYLSVISGTKYKLNTTLYKLTAGVLAPLGNATFDSIAENSCGAGSYYTITRDSTYDFSVSVAWDTGCTQPGTILTFTDATYTTSSVQVLKFVTAAAGYTDLELDSIYVPARTAQIGVFTSRVFDTQFNTPIGGVFSATSVTDANSSAVFGVRGSVNGVTWGAPTTIVDGARVNLSEKYWQYVSTLSIDAGGVTMPTVSEVVLNAISTGTWDSEVLYVGGSLTSWGQFNGVTEGTDEATVDFYTRASTFTFAQNATIPTWTSQPNGLNLVISTGAYVQTRAVSHVHSSTDVAQVTSITLNWYEGEVKSVASLYFDKNYYLAVNISTVGTTNETTLVLQRTGKWTIFDGLSYGTLGLYNLQPYAGSGLTDSKIWRIMNEGTFYDDNDKAINAYVITKDFQFDGQNNNKILRQFYLESFPTTSGVLSMAYSVDKSTTYFTTDKNLVANTMFNDEVKGMFPGFSKGRYVKFKFSNATVNEYFKLDAYTILGEYERLYRR